MKKYFVVAACLFGSMVVSTFAASLNFTALPGSTLQFNGAASSFQINNNLAGNQWWITSVSGGTGSATALLGSFGGGPWSYGAITIAGSDQSAAVAGPATLTINDGAGFLAQANLNWVRVSTLNAVGGLNAGLTVNLSGMTYAGANPDLISVFSGPSGYLNLSFQFNPGKTLADLTTGNGPYTTSYSGSIVPVPEPTSLGLLSLGLIALLGRFGRGK